MTEEEALERVHEIGTAFDNDYNEGSGPDFEGVYVTSDGFDGPTLTYRATNVEDYAEEFEFVWQLKLVNGPPG